MEGKRAESIRSLERVGVASILFLASILFIGIPSPEASQTPGRTGRVLEFLYRAPEAGEVFLIWGIEGWQTVPEKERPPGTAVRNRVMHTPMVRRGSSFQANVSVDPDVSVEYGFLVTKTYDGLELEVRPVWDGRKEFQVGAGEFPDPLEIDSSLELFPRIDLGTLLYGLAYLLFAIAAAFLIDFLFRRVHSRSDRSGPVVALIVIVAIGLALRIGTAVVWNHDRPDSPARLIGDEPGFDSMARQLLDGHGFTWPGRVPLYPVWLAAVYGISGGSVHAVPYFQSLLGVATILITFFLGKSIFGPRAGLLASFWVSASYVLVQQPLHLLSEALYTPVLLLLMLSLAKAFSEPTRYRFFAAGALIGVANLVRPALLFFPLFLAVLIPFVQDRKKMAKYWFGLCAVSFLVVLPWILHNHLKYRAIIPLQTSNAILWQGSPEYYHLVHDRGYTYLRIWNEILYGPGWQQHDPTSIAGDRYWTGRALESILAEPTVYLKYAGEKIFTYWLGDPSADWGNRHIFSYAGLRQIGFPPHEAVQVIFARFLPIVALVALFILRSEGSKILPLLVMMGYFNLLHAMTHAEARLSEPLQPMLLILTGGAVMMMIDKARERKIAGRSLSISPSAGK